MIVYCVWVNNDSIMKILIIKIIVVLEFNKKGLKVILLADFLLLFLI